MTQMMDDGEDKSEESVPITLLCWSQCRRRR